jgi:hypothetical protein
MKKGEIWSYRIPIHRISAIEAFKNNTGTKLTERDVLNILLSLSPAIIKKIQKKQDGISSAEILEIITGSK